MAQRIFPVLAGYPAERIELFMPSDSNGWARIMDEAWIGFLDTPPKRLLVQVADGPGDARRRESSSHHVAGVEADAMQGRSTASLLALCPQVLFCFLLWGYGNSL